MNCRTLRLWQVVDIHTNKITQSTLHPAPVDAWMFRFPTLSGHPKQPGCGGRCGAKPISDAGNKPMFGRWYWIWGIVWHSHIDTKPQYRWSARKYKLERNQQPSQLISQSIGSQGFQSDFAFFHASEPSPQTLGHHLGGRSALCRKLDKKNFTITPTLRTPPYPPL